MFKIQKFVNFSKMVESHGCAFNVRHTRLLKFSETGLNTLNRCYHVNDINLVTSISLRSRFFTSRLIATTNQIFISVA